MINELDLSLSRCAAVPFVGTLPAVIKMTWGALQMVVSLLLSILALPALCCEKTAYVDKSVAWVGEGAERFFKGCAEAMPLLGTYLQHEGPSPFAQAFDKKRGFNPFWLCWAVGKAYWGMVSVISLLVYFIIRLIPNLYFRNREDAVRIIENVKESYLLIFKGLVEIVPTARLNS